MAGDWIPFDHELPDKEEVLALAALPNLTYSEKEARLGVTLLRLCRLWIWADRHTETGLLRDMSVTGVTLKCDGDEAFWRKVIISGWLDEVENGLQIPKFAERFGRSARSRLLAAKRKRRQRAKEAEENGDEKRDKSVTSSVTEAGHKRDMSRQPEPLSVSLPESDPDPESKPQRAMDASASICSEPLSATSEPMTDFAFPIVGKGPKTWALPEAKLAEFRESFPALDLERELRSARQWCRDNPGKRKTARGMPAFLSRWLTTAQNRGRGGNQRNDPRGTVAALEEYLETNG